MPYHLDWTAYHVGLVRWLAFGFRLARHRHLAARPASMQASEDPMAEAPTALAA